MDTEQGESPAPLPHLQGGERDPGVLEGFVFGEFPENRWSCPGGAALHEENSQRSGSVQRAGGRAGFPPPAPRGLCPPDPGRAPVGNDGSSHPNKV